MDIPEVLIEKKVVYEKMPCTIASKVQWLTTGMIIGFIFGALVK